MVPAPDAGGSFEWSTAMDHDLQGQARELLTRIKHLQESL